MGRSNRPAFLLLINKIMEHLFTKKEAARYLKVSERTVDRLRSEMEIPVYRIRGQVRIPASSINKILKGPMSGDERDKIINDILEV